MLLFKFERDVIVSHFQLCKTETSARKIELRCSLLRLLKRTVRRGGRRRPLMKGGPAMGWGSCNRKRLRGERDAEMKR